MRDVSYPEMALGTKTHGCYSLYFSSLDTGESCAELTNFAVELIWLVSNSPIDSFKFIRTEELN